MSQTKENKKLTIPELKARKLSADAPKIVAVTAYDYTFARLVDGVADVVLVGDSLGMVIQGHSNTLPVTLDDMIYHGRAVSRGLSRSHLCIDMPFLTYQASPRDAIRNAGRLMQLGRAESVKVEGGVTVAPTVARLVELGIPVLGHIGLTPQSVHAMGGHRVQGRTDTARDSILADALALEAAGAWGIVLEGMPSALAATISERVRIPTIGIGAGKQCDGQVLVLQDLLGLDPTFAPKFVKQYARLGDVVKEAVGKYAQEVREGAFPAEAHSFH
jgi:3-methyl-2-oxobutanoate hydroxymethyltransferase